MDSLVQRLRALSRVEHDDFTIGEEAADELERLQRENAELHAEFTRVSEEIDTLERASVLIAKENAELRADAERLKFVYKLNATTSNALVEIELKLLNGVEPTIDEVLDAIDEAMNEPK
jgi:phosphoglycerate dehydrogenase-like enzyme